MTDLTAPGNCRVCGYSNAGCNVYVCPRCNTPHHQECWAYVGSCAMYGCGFSQAELVVAAPSDDPTIREAFCIIFFSGPLFIFKFGMGFELLKVGACLCVGVPIQACAAQLASVAWTVAVVAVLSIPVQLLNFGGVCLINYLMPHGARLNHVTVPQPIAVPGIRKEES